MRVTVAAEEKEKEEKEEAGLKEGEFKVLENKPCGGGS